MKLVRILVPIFVLLAVIAGSVGLTAGSATVAADNGSSAIRLANSNFEINGATSDNVYQQQVVALWGVKDMVEATAQQNVTIIDAQVEILKSQNSIASMTRGVLIVLVLLIGMLGLLGGSWLKAQSRGARVDRESESVDIAFGEAPEGAR
jgi:hypothetical protein